MAVQLNHTIVASRDKQAAARFVTELFGLADPVPFGPFLAVALDNDVTLDYIDSDDVIVSQHYAFLISESDFDEIYGKIRERDLPHWADPAQNRPGAINTNDGGRGVYFHDLDGHYLEIITRPYGSGG